MTTTVAGEYTPKQTVDFIELNLYGLHLIVFIFVTRPITCTPARSRTNIIEQKID